MNCFRLRQDANGLVRTVAMSFTFACCIYAQGTSAQMNGVVRDASGALIPQAQIAVTNIDTHVQRKSVSNGEGAYVVPLLPPGNYTIDVQKSGFQPVRRTGITL